MAEADRAGRTNQKRRTRKALLEATARLMKDGRRPSFDEVAAEALVSRATAYRYFPGVEPLLVEAALDLEMPSADALLADDATGDPLARLRRVDEAMQAMIRANEPALRRMLIHSLEQGLGGNADLPVRQNRRTPLIEAALEPARERFSPAAFDRLAKALALVIGTESTLVFKDVLGIGDAEADALRAWMIRALLLVAEAGG